MKYSYPLYRPNRTNLPVYWRILACVDDLQMKLDSYDDYEVVNYCDLDKIAGGEKFHWPLRK